MKRKIISKIIFATFSFIYVFAIITHSFFQKTNLNKILSTKLFFAQFYSFPVLFGGIVSIISIIALAFIIYKNKFNLKRKLGIFFLLIILITSLIFMFFGVERTKNIEDQSENDSFKIVEYNALNNINSDIINKIFKQFDADIAVFPELDGYYKGDVSNQRLKDLFKLADINFNNYDVFISRTTSGSIAPVTIIIKKEFTSYTNNENIPMTRFGTLLLESKDKEIPNIIGIHTAPPLPGLMDMWKRDLELIANLSKEIPNSIIVGDFNATMRHGDLNKIESHQDAMNYLPFYERGTWNNKLPQFLRIPIDHILLPKDKYIVKNIEVEDLHKSDHLGVFIEVSKKE